MDPQPLRPVRPRMRYVRPVIFVLACTVSATELGDGFSLRAKIDASDLAGAPESWESWLAKLPTFFPADGPLGFAQPSWMDGFSTFGRMDDVPVPPPEPAVTATLTRPAEQGLSFFPPEQPDAVATAAFPSSGGNGGVQTFLPTGTPPISGNAGSFPVGLPEPYNRPPLTNPALSGSGGGGSGTGLGSIDPSTVPIDFTPGPGVGVGVPTSVPEPVSLAWLLAVSPLLRRRARATIAR